MGGLISRYAKATVPAGFALSNAVSVFIATGQLDKVAIAVAVQGLIAGIWVALVPNSRGLQAGDVVNIGGTLYTWQDGRWEGTLGPSAADR